jgi:hypothetical protein
MKIRIEKFGHLRDRMQERGISEADIRGILAHFTGSWTSAHGKSRVFQGTTPDGRVLRVVVIHPPDPDGTIQVKTAYEPSKEGTE